MKNTLLTSLSLAVVGSIPAYADHPICGTRIAGVSSSQSVDEISSVWASNGLQDITCNGPSKVSCEARRDHNRRYANTPRGFLVDVEDRRHTLVIDKGTKAPSGLVEQVRVVAPDTYTANDDKRSWDGWSEKALIEAKIAQYCDQAAPAGTTVDCNYRRGVKISVYVGKPQNPECTYVFEAEFKPPYGPTPAGHTVSESVRLRPSGAAHMPADQGNTRTRTRSRERTQ